MIVSPALRMEIEELVADFWYRVDRGSPESVADLFTAEGEYIWSGHGRSAGREAIRQSYRERARLGVRTVRHLFTNLRVEIARDDEVLASSILLLFAEDGPPPHLAAPLLVADVDDVLVRESGHWRFKSRTLTDIFVATGRSPVLPMKAER
jgi:hypothetical protein